MFKQQKVETVRTRTRVNGMPVFCRVQKDILFPQSLTLGILETNIQVEG